MATHSSTLAWRIPWTVEPGGLQSMGSQRVGHNWASNTHTHTHTHTTLSSVHKGTVCHLEATIASVTKTISFQWCDPKSLRLCFILASLHLTLASSEIKGIKNLSPSSSIIVFIMQVGYNCTDFKRKKKPLYSWVCFLYRPDSELQNYMMLDNVFII